MIWLFVILTVFTTVALLQTLSALNSVAVAAGVLGTALGVWSLGQKFSEDINDTVEIYKWTQNTTYPQFDAVEIRYVYPKSFSEYKLVFDPVQLNPQQYLISTKFDRKTRERETRPLAKDQGKTMFGEPKNEILVARDYRRPPKSPDIVFISTQFYFPKGTDLNAKIQQIDIRKYESKASPTYRRWVRSSTKNGRGSWDIPS